MVVFNFIGLGMLAAGFGLGYLLCLAVGTTAEPPLMLAGGALVLVIDLAFRTTRTKLDREAWYEPLAHPKRGGQLFWLPIWLWGLVWLNLGGFRILTNSN